MVDFFAGFCCGGLLVSIAWAVRVAWDNEPPPPSGSPGREELARQAWENMEKCRRRVERLRRKHISAKAFAREGQKLNEDIEETNRLLELHERSG